MRAVTCMQVCALGLTWESASACAAQKLVSREVTILVYSPGLVWSGAVWFLMFWSSMAWSGLVGLGWYRLGSSVSVWSGHVRSGALSDFP